MEKVTEADLLKVKKFLSVMAEQYPGPTGNSGDQYQAKAIAHREATPGAHFLIHYYFRLIEPDNGQTSIALQGPRPYGTTKTERAIRGYNDVLSGDVYQNYNSNYLTDALAHYESSQKERLNEVLGKTLNEISGEQLLLLLKEHDRRRDEGYEITLPIFAPVA